MKMTPTHYEDLKQKVSVFVSQIPDHIDRLKKDPKVKDLNTRLLWDVFHATKIMNQYSYQEFDYSDAHIETAMRAVFKELKISLQ